MYLFLLASLDTENIFKIPNITYTIYNNYNTCQYMLTLLTVLTITLNKNPWNWFFIFLFFYMCTFGNKPDRKYLFIFIQYAVALFELGNLTTVQFLRYLHYLQ